MKASTTTGDRRSSTLNGASTVPPPVGSPAVVRTQLPTRQRRAHTVRCRGCKERIGCNMQDLTGHKANRR